AACNSTRAYLASGEGLYTPDAVNRIGGASRRPTNPSLSPKPRFLEKQLHIEKSAKILPL
ncbi:hypothetical protein, partial [Enterobacter roggenkampii]|uniref:hypothetical protein n=1 Tax=Enterobacter roggenkampii TaxID=1812935 RepID=UPI001C0BBEC4